MWPTSYLKNSTQSVVAAVFKPDSASLTGCAPKGSVLDPDFFTDWSSQVGSLIRSFNISVHCYADDNQFYCHFTSGMDENVLSFAF